MNTETRMDPIGIMVVDDEQDIREATERILMRQGFAVFQATCGEEALATFEKEHPAIIILDLKMPGMDGMEVLARVREIDESVLVIVITGYATVETAIQAMKEGAYDFIPKPFEPDQLRIVVRRAQEKLRLTWETARLEEQRRLALFDLDTEKSRIRTIIESLPNGVVVTNTTGQVVLMNPAFVKYLNLKPGARPGNQIEAYIPDQGLCHLVMEISRGQHVDYNDIPTYDLALSNNTFFQAHGRPVIGERNECLGAVVNLVDITALKVLDQMKSEFVAKVSHELRSPLSTIHEQLALVIQDLVDDSFKNDQHILARAREKTEGLISFIGDLLDLSRIESGVVSQQPKPVHLEKILKNIVDFLEIRAGNKNQTLSLQIPEGPLPTIVADPLVLESIFGNLITNAINYTPQSGEIRVSVDLAGINLRVKVMDNGFGMEARHLAKIFEKFYRVKDDNTRQITGTGLGLSIVKGLLDAMGGLIEVESTPGKGSIFTVLLPLGDG